MNSIAAQIQAGFEPIPGYVLREKLGAGGYGDVWSADAPGGLKKAIKFVHGSIDENRAAAELKSLQRIRQVNHPFILSLERIEIIDGQLIIVTELAQGSLYDRYVQFREKGFVGISRDRLLTYLRDAADGLDFLCQKHDLQHLDVKPGNLLLVSDRIKVADFGLVKDLQSNTLSLMGGLTPTYAAPEMFDGRPGRYSDQYSLAIVYQEMLTGTLPFRGRTTAQLANEHLHKAPMLDDLPAAERPIIARALSKKPQQRYADCRELITAIERVDLQEDANKSDKVQTRGWSPKGKGNEKLSRVMPTSSPHSISLEAKRLSPSTSNGSPESTKAPTKTGILYIGIGGIGAEAIATLRQLKQNLHKDSADRFLAIDTDGRSLEALVDRDRPWRLDYGSVLHIPLKSPHYYREESHFYAQLSRRWVYNIPRSQLTEGVRPLGMLALLDHAAHCYDRLGQIVSEIAETRQGNASSPILVEIICSSMGGTGGAIVCEIGFLLRQIAVELRTPITIELCLTCAAPSPTALGDLASASSIACLLEIHHFFQTGGLHPEIPNIPQTFVSRPPFDSVKLFYGGQLQSSSDRQQCLMQLANHLLLEDHSSEVDRVSHSEDESNDSPKWLTTIALNAFPIDLCAQPKQTSASILLHSILPWVAHMDTNDASSELNLSQKELERVDFLVADVMRACNWNAQAWVRECMTAILPDSPPPKVEALSATVENRENSSVLEEEQLREIEHICQQLAVEPAHSLRSVEELFQTCTRKLLQSLAQHWLESPSHWSIVPKVIESLSDKLKVHSNSLLVVAKKLGDKHDAMLEELERGIIQNDRRVDEQLGKLSIESRFHSLSARMLLRFISHLHHYLYLWKQTSHRLRTEIISYGNRLSEKEFGLSIDKFVQNGPPPKNDPFKKSVRSAVSYLITMQWSRICRTELDIPTPPILETSKEEWNSHTEFSRQLDSLLRGIHAEVENYMAPTWSQHDTTKPTKAEAFGQTPLTGGMTILDASSTGKTGQAATSSSGPSSKRGFDELESKLEQIRPYLAEFGGTVKQTLCLSEFVWSQIPQENQRLIEKFCFLRLSNDARTPTLITEGADLNIENIVDRIWMPSSETWQLVPRVLSRVDIEWTPFGQV